MPSDLHHVRDLDPKLKFAVGMALNKLEARLAKRLQKGQDSYGDLWRNLTIKQLEEMAQEELDDYFIYQAMIAYKKANAR